MNKIVDTSTRVFMAVVGPSVSGKTVNIQTFERKNILSKV